MSSYRRDLPLVIIALLGGLAVYIWSSVEPALLFESPDVQLRMVEIYIQVIGVLLGFYGVIVTQRDRASTSHWLWVPPMVFLICIILEVGSYLHVAAVPVVEDMISANDWWVYLANFMFFLGIFIFAFALVMILRKESPE